MTTPSREDIEMFQKLVNTNRYDFCKLAYIIFPFGEPGTELEHEAPYDWQMEEWARLSRHLNNPLTRFESYWLIISSGNGAAKTAFGAMTYLILMYTQRLRARIMANTQPQLTSVVWPEYDIWFRRARFVDVFFEKFGTTIKAKNERLADTWRLDAVTWNETSPSSVSGLHNKGGAMLYILEEAPGIPAVIWNYISGAFTEIETIKIWLAFGNSDDPESKFEQNMTSPLWNARRIDTRTLKHIDPKQIENWLMEAGGDENNDEFRVRVRGLPRKTARDSIINVETVEAAFARAADFDFATVKMLPAILTCDPAWQGGDETCIAFKQGNYTCLLEKYKLDKSTNETHMITYQKICFYERQLAIDAVLIDQAEGTTLYTLAQNAGKTSWFLIAFAAQATDQLDPASSEFGNIRAQMYYNYASFLRQGGVLDVRDPDWRETTRKQLTWAKGARHKVTGKKMVEAKLEIKKRVGQSPDVADALVLTQAMTLIDRLPEHTSDYDPNEAVMIGQSPLRMPEHRDPYEAIDAEFERLYDR